MSLSLEAGSSCCVMAGHSLSGLEVSLSLETVSVLRLEVSLSLEASSVSRLEVSLSLEACSSCCLMAGHSLSGLRVSPCSLKPPPLRGGSRVPRERGGSVCSDGGGGWRGVVWRGVGLSRAVTRGTKW